MNLKRQLAMAQLDQMAQEEDARANEEAMKLLGFALQAHQSQQNHERGLAQDQLDQMRFEEAKRQFGVSAQQTNDSLNWQKARQEMENSRLDSAIKREIDLREQDMEYKRKRDEISDSRYIDEFTRESEEFAAKKAAQPRMERLQALQVLGSAGISSEALQQIISEYFPQLTKTQEPRPQPQGGVMDRTAVTNKLQELRGQDTTPPQQKLIETIIKAAGLLSPGISHPYPSELAKQFKF